LKIRVLVVGCVGFNVSKDLIVFIFNAIRWRRGSSSLPNVWSHTPRGTASHPTRSESSALPLQGPLFLNNQQQGVRFLSSWMHLLSDCPKTLLSSTGIPYIDFVVPFLGAFAKSPKATISFVSLSVRLSAWNELASHWKNFHEIWYPSIFGKSVKQIQVLNKQRPTWCHLLYYFII